MPVAAALEKILLNAFTSSTIDIHEHTCITELYSKDIDIDRLEIQLKMLPDLLKSFNSANPSQKIKKITSLRTVSDLLNSDQSNKTMLSDVIKLLKIGLTIPVTSATAERTFSVRVYFRHPKSQ